MSSTLLCIILDIENGDFEFCEKDWRVFFAALFNGLSMIDVLPPLISLPLPHFFLCAVVIPADSPFPQIIQSNE